MNWTKLTFLSSAALAVAAAPMASAQGHAHISSAPRSQLSSPRMGSFGARSAQWRGSDFNRTSNLNRSSNTVPGSQIATQAGTGRNWQSGVHGTRHGNWQNRPGNSNGSRWANHNHGGHHHHRFHGYHPGYHPFGYGYGFGYPYWGTSATFFYDNDYYNGNYGGYQGSAGSIVMNVQQELARAGYYRGAIDGVLGEGTRRAIRAYERDNGLRVDGRIDNRLLSSMGLS